MSDIPPPPPAGSPPPPPPSYPPPPPAFQPPPGYAPSATPGQVPPPYQPAAVGTGIALGYQFSGDALWSVALGLASTILPFVIHLIFFFLPLIGIVYGVRAIMRGRMIGGIVGIVLNVIGGAVTLLSLLG